MVKHKDGSLKVYHFCESNLYK